MADGYWHRANYSTLSHLNNYLLSLRVYESGIQLGPSRILLAHGSQGGESGAIGQSGSPAGLHGRSLILSHGDFLKGTAGFSRDNRGQTKPVVCVLI